MKKHMLLLAFLYTMVLEANAQFKTENVILISLDGLRWQEVYNGADSLLIDDSGYVENPESLVEKFWSDEREERKNLLMPFFSKYLTANGQLYGNRSLENKVNCSNNHWFSYPGYNEILSGFSDDDRINSNDKLPNPNKTVLEFINEQKGFEGKVAAFGSWDVFPFIINEERSGIPVNAGFESVVGENLTEREILLNQLQKEVRSPWGGVRLDVFTHHFAMEYLKKKQPRMLYIAYGETDDYAHGGHYDDYLESAWQTDKYISEIWNFVQSNPAYKDKTTMIITTDHGRGTNPKDTWRSHGTRISNAGEIWIAAIGPDTKPLGIMELNQQLYQNQIASTVATLLGLNYENEKPVGNPISTLFGNEDLTDNYTEEK